MRHPTRLPHTRSLCVGHRSLIRDTGTVRASPELVQIVCTHVLPRNPASTLVAVCVHIQCSPLTPRGAVGRVRHTASRTTTESTGMIGVDALWLDVLIVADSAAAGILGDCGAVQVMMDVFATCQNNVWNQVGGGWTWVPGMFLPAWPRQGYCRYHIASVVSSAPCPLMSHVCAMRTYFSRPSSPFAHAFCSHGRMCQ